jgi:chromosome segregation ATPase
VRKFPGEFDYYLEKRDKGEIFIVDTKRKIKVEDKGKEEEKERLKQEEIRRKEEQKQRKAHNAAIGKKINKLKKEKERLDLEYYAKSRALSNPSIYRDAEATKNYQQRIEQIEKRRAEMEEEISRLRAGFFRI